MIELDIPQGSEGWIQARLGVATGSEFSRIVTPSGKPSSGQLRYASELIAEYVLGQPVKEFEGNFATQRGVLMEPEARKVFAFQYDVEPRTTGFCYKDESKHVGCSPDWLIDDMNAVGEIKTPFDPGIHLMYLAEGILPKEYFCQCQAHLYVTGRERCIFMSYYPHFPSLIVTVEADEKYQAALNEHIPKFVEKMLERREQLRAQGVTPVKELWESESSSSSAASETA